MKYGVFDNGVPRGFYSKEIHGDNIPVEAVEISDAQWMELLDNPDTRRFEDGHIIVVNASSDGLAV
ncbi:hypothetical protein ACQZ40_01875 [Agrobacterium sp. 16-172Ci]